MTRQEIPVFKTREENVAYMNETLPIQESFDLIQRDLLIGGRVSSFYFVNGFTSEETMLKIMDALLKVKEEEMPEDVWEFANACIPYVEVEVFLYWFHIFINKIQKFVRHQIVFDEAFFALFYKCFERFHVAFLLSLSRNILAYL